MLVILMVYGSSKHLSKNADLKVLWKNCWMLFHQAHSMESSKVITIIFTITMSIISRLLGTSMEVSTSAFCIYSLKVHSLLTLSLRDLCQSAKRYLLVQKLVTSPWQLFHQTRSWLSGIFMAKKYRQIQKWRLFLRRNGSPRWNLTLKCSLSLMCF